jgi:hypothetical protein
MVEKIKLIFFGETHGFIDDFKKQKEILDEINPEFVLFEQLENHLLMSQEDFQKIISLKKISDMTEFNEIAKIVNYCYKKSIKLIGIDFKNFGFSKNLQEKVKNQRKITEEENLELLGILEKRTEHHIEIIKRYMKKTSNQLVIILGAWHLRNDSKLLNSFKNYKLILPCDSQGEILISPPKKNEKVFYCEKVKNGK